MAADLVAPAVEEEVSNGEEEREEDRVGEVERERESVGGLGRGSVPPLLGVDCSVVSGGRRPAMEVHCGRERGTPKMKRKKEEKEYMIVLWTCVCQQKIGLDPTASSFAVFLCFYSLLFKLSFFFFFFCNHTNTS